MDDLELRIIGAVDRFSKSLQQALITWVRIVSLPFTLPVQLAKLSVPPALHVAIFLSLLPVLGIFSISAGVIVTRWIPEGWSEPLYLQYGDGQTPYAFAILKGLSTSQPYDISLQLVVPTSPSNYELGNFMSSIVLSTLNNRTVIGAAQRPAVLVPPRSPLRLFSPILTTISVPLLDSFVPSYSSLRARVEVGRADGWKQLGRGEGRELAVVNAHVKGNVKLTGLTSILALSPLLTQILTTVTFFISSTLFAVVLYFVYAPSFASLLSTKDEADSTAIVPPRKTGRRSRSGSREIKTEQDQPSGSLRRRRSRLSDSGQRAPSGSSR